MSSSEQYVPKHRAPGKHRREREPRRLVRRAAVTAGVAAVSTGVAVSSGVLSQAPDMVAADTATDVSTDIAAASLADRAVVSRADRRGARDPLKQAALSTEAGLVTKRTQTLDDSDPREVARALMPEFGFSVSQFGCLDSLYVSESDWRVDADNPTSSAYGIPQALTRTHDLPEGYMTSAEVQIRWGLEYIKNRYGTPCAAWSFKAANNWY
ncbi:lytic transglycosylase domain-containing protein [Nocardioides solisilvae]|uniref:aggregation-promoting factor C-terminal-like domain-containing protein n=1 Tax=Nocardioides solisilvae TaxID=1542435 RepID=UPI000D744A1A|nr:lytic transglycosylase domain-containing protein [Nocardioides solisilvae]